MQQFSCPMCGTTIEYDYQDSSTYMSLEESNSRMMGKLYSLRVAHEIDGTSHVNVVVLDADGQYRAHKDTYTEEIKSTSGEMLEWGVVQRLIPFELGPYLDVVPTETKLRIIKFFNTINPQNMEEQQLAEYLTNLWNDFPEDPYLAFILGKWLFITGNYESHPVFEIVTSDSWLLPTLLRIKSRYKPSKEILEELSVSVYENEIMEADYVMAYAEIAIRAGASEQLEAIYSAYKDKWENYYNVFVKIALNTIQSYYGYNLFQQGKYQESLSYVEGAYNFASIIQHRHMLTIVGNFYASVLKNSGKLEDAAEVYAQLLSVAIELNDERSEIMITSNLGAVELQRGRIEEALFLFEKLYEAPMTQKDANFRLAAVINRSLALQQLSRDEEAIILLQEVMEYESLSFAYSTPVFDAYLRSVRNTQNADLLNLLENRIDYEELENVPVGQILIHDLKATRHMLNQDWDNEILELNQALRIMHANNQLEVIVQVELRLAEAYLNKYYRDKDGSDLNACYEHLDLIRAISGGDVYYLLICQILILKGVIAQNLNYKERAQALFLHAIEYSRSHGLGAFIEQIEQHLDNLNKESENADSENSRTLFRQIMNFAQRLSLAPSSSEFVVLALLVVDFENHWASAAVIEGSDYTDYLRGITDIILPLGFEKFVGMNEISASKGKILVEFSEKFMVLAITEEESYSLRVKMQELGDRIDNFELVDILEERAEFLNSIRTEIFGSLTRVKLLNN